MGAVGRGIPAAELFERGSRLVRGATAAKREGNGSLGAPYRAKTAGEKGQSVLGLWKICDRAAGEMPLEMGGYPHTRLDNRAGDLWRDKRCGLPGV